MSKTSARHQALQEFLSARGYATIEELARHFEVTPQTVRKDINAFVEQLRPRVKEIHFEDTRKPDYAPRFLNTPLVLGQMGVIWGRK